MSQSIFDLSNRDNMFYWQTNRKISAQDMKQIFLDRRNTVSEADTIAAIEYGLHQAGKTDQAAKVATLGKPIPFGSVNNVIKVTLQDGTRVVVRMHPYFVKNGYFWAEKEATRQAKQVGVPTYETYFIDDSMSKFDFCFMIIESLPGKTLQEYWPIDPDLDKILIQETGKYVAMIHQVHPQGFGFFKNDIAKNESRLQGQYSSLKQHFYAGLDEDLHFLTNSQLFTSEQADKILKIFSRQENLLACSKATLVHNDIADWNELFDGSHITGIIDWDECFAGDPAMDFAQWSLFFDNNRLQHFIEGYQTISSLPAGYQEKDHLFRLRYTVSKLHLRKKRALVATDSKFLNERIVRGMEVMQEEFKHYGLLL